MALKKNSLSIVLTTALLCATTFPLIRGAVDSVITQWLTIAQSTVLSLGIEHQQAARVYAVVAFVQYDSICIARQNKNHRIPEEAAAAFASHAALSHLFSWRQTAIYDVALVRHLAQYNVSDAQIPVLQSLLVRRVQRVLQERLVDGASFFANFRPATNSSANIGRYQFTPGQTTSRYPQVAKAKGFYLKESDVEFFTKDFKAYSLDDPEYARELEQVFLYGSLNSTVRSEYDTGSPRFWALGTGTGTIAGVWLNISISVIPENTSLIHQAHFFKVLTTSFWDAAIACWRTKYRELFWRPITAIRTPHGHPACYDPTWTPLLSTPAHPEYPSGHQCSSGAAVYVLEAYIGTNIPFTAVSQGAPDLGVRSYPNFHAAGIDSGNSRLYAGVHFNKSNIDALHLGYNIAQYIHRTKFGGKTFSAKL